MTYVGEPIRADVGSVSTRRKRATAFVVSGIPIAVVAVLGWERRWVSDDAFINVRVIHNLFDGSGPVFNAGERVEVGTSTLWLVVLAVGRVVFPYASVELFAVIAGLVATVAGLALASAGAALLWRSKGQSGVALPLGISVFATLPPVWDFATSGLETGLSTLWLGASFWLLVRRLRHSALPNNPLRPPAWRPASVPCVIGLGALVRPDLALIAVLFGLALLAQSRWSWRSWAGGTAVAVAIPVAYEIFRAGYYGALVPNTALAKGAGSALVSQGMRYLDDYAGRYFLIVPFALGLGAFVAPMLVMLRRHRDLPTAALVVAPIVGGVLHATFVIRVGGDFMHGRLLLPATFAMLLPVACVVAGRGSLLRPYPLLPLVLVVFWILAVSTSVRVPYTSEISSDGIANERMWYSTRSMNRNPVHPEDFDTPLLLWYGWASSAKTAAITGDRSFVDFTGRWPAAAAYRHVVRAGSIGIFGVQAGRDVFVADWLSLAHPIGARLDVPLSPGSRIGHAQYVPIEWDIARFARPSPSDTPAVVAARAALGCGALKELIENTTAPLTLARFVENVIEAPRMTRLRIPLDPSAAAAQLCR